MILISYKLNTFLMLDVRDVSKEKKTFKQQKEVSH